MVIVYNAARPLRARGQRSLRRNSVFENLKALPPDAILRLIAEHQNDPREHKIDLGVGVYRDEHGATPVLDAVKKAERRLVDGQVTKAYLGSGGDPVFNDAMQRLVFADAASGSDRITTVQTPGGSGALRVAAGLILRARPDVSVWTSEPTWANHVPLLGGAGVQLKTYPYYDAQSRSIRLAAMLDTLNRIPAGDIVLLHGCCHNPTGVDLEPGQWREVAAVIESRHLLPFIDFAYQGFAEGLEEDAFPVRLMFERMPEMIVSSSCSKNFGLYRERVGSLSLVAADAAAAAIVRSQVFNIVRTMYSMPPDHGAAVVASILTDAELRTGWLAELLAMRSRLKETRKLLVASLRDRAPAHDFSHIERGNGMFSFLGVSGEQVSRLKSEFGVYMVDSSRINVAGITRGNVGYLGESIAAVL
jgi:aspartate/tyrosine/aromatic aminotransferase